VYSLCKNIVLKYVYVKKLKYGIRYRMRGENKEMKEEKKERYEKD
jgi:hypothetical protein